MSDNPPDVGKFSKHSIKAHSSDRQSSIEWEAHKRTEHILGECLRVCRNHWMQENTHLHAICFAEKWLVSWRGERVTSNVAKQDYAIHLQIINNPMQLFDGFVRSIHRYRGESFETHRIL